MAGVEVGVFSLFSHVIKLIQLRILAYMCVGCGATVNLSLSFHFHCGHWPPKTNVQHPNGFNLRGPIVKLKTEFTALNATTSLDSESEVTESMVIFLVTQQCLYIVQSPADNDWRLSCTFCRFNVCSTALHCSS